MSLSASLKRIPRSCNAPKRYSSTSAPPPTLTRKSKSTRPSTTDTPIASQHTLPSAKMRALISLYHQSDSFVTPENLSERIDKAFLINSVENSLRQLNMHEPHLSQLRHEVSSRRSQPAVSEWDNQRVATSAAAGMHQWRIGHARERKVIEALYGVDVSTATKKLPGLAVLEESREEIRKELEEDKVRREESREDRFLEDEQWQARHAEDGVKPPS
ncbi:hypothetical protein BDQ12DRAFT_674521 [Crucibulum laeve]|uniref:Uncharacterized protein n=1 Tax=Crucibulum laeve TaxID=68775 RepID=A0A5C3MPN2_9AGAR|nr:hypothetical protein BDQ12DRAFT_674521 [Crucibulum laeve]